MIGARIGAVAIVAVGLGIVGGGCSSDDEHLGVSRSAITSVEGELLATPVSAITGEPHAAWVNTATRGAAWVVGVNHEFSAPSLSGRGRAVDTAQGTLPTWQFCNFVAGGGYTGCGLGGASVPMFSLGPCLPGPPPNCGMGGSKTQRSWNGDPIVATTRQADGFVAYVSMATSMGQTGNPDQVVVSMSNDGGISFTATDWVNIAGPDTCDTGQQDQPHAYIDTTVAPPVLWVVWRHAGSGAFGGCMRGGTIVTSPTPSITWFDSGHSIANMQHSFGQGIGGVMIGAVNSGTAASRVTVVYSSTDVTPKSGPANAAFLINEFQFSHTLTSQARFA